MGIWIVSIPTRPTHGNTGRQMFVIDAASPEQATQRALRQADSDSARRSRREADLDLWSPATVEAYRGFYGTLELLGRLGIDS